MSEDIAKIYKILEEQRQRIELVYISVEKTRKYFLYTMIISIVLFILPLIGIAFAIPSFLNAYTSQDLQSLQGL